MIYLEGGSAGDAEVEAAGTGAPFPAVPEPNPSLLKVPAGATILRTTVQQPDQQ